MTRQAKLHVVTQRVGELLDGFRIGRARVRTESELLVNRDLHCRCNFAADSLQTRVVYRLAAARPTQLHVR